jgi:hypothetical protein
MDEVFIEWNSHVIPYSNIQENENCCLDKNGFYMVLTGKYNVTTNKYTNIKLQYIGQAYDQSIRKRVPQPHVAYNEIQQYLNVNSGYKALVISGIITESSQKKITAELFDDIEACLIFCNQPLTNTQNKESYKGREIVITNTGTYFPLEEVAVG